MSSTKLADHEKMLWAAYNSAVNEFVRSRAALLKQVTNPRDIVVYGMSQGSLFDVVLLLEMFNQDDLRSVFDLILEEAVYQSGVRDRYIALVMSMPLEWLKANIAEYGNEIIKKGLDDPVAEYRGLFNLYLQIDADLVRQLALNALEDGNRLANPDLIEAGTDMLEALNPDTSVANIRFDEGEFGDQLVTHYQRIIQEILEKSKGSIQGNFIESYFHSKFAGYTDAEINAIAAADGFTFLPVIYTSYLRVMGRNAGGIFRGSDRKLEDVKHLTDGLFEAVRELADVGKDTPEIPDNAFVFMGLQGVDFFFFLLQPGEDDPGVYYYNEGRSQYYKVADKLSSWFTEHGRDPLGYALAVRDGIPYEDD